MAKKSEKVTTHALTGEERDAVQSAFSRLQAYKNLMREPNITDAIEDRYIKANAAYEKVGSDLVQKFRPDLVDSLHNWSCDFGSCTFTITRV